MHTVLGLAHGENRLVEYCEEWPFLFGEEKARISAALGDQILAIEHVGSTAVPGLAAKPVIDIAVAVANLSIADALAPAMTAIGYDYPGDIGIPDHRIYARDREVRTYLVHIIEHGGYRWNELIAFRDMLRRDVELANEYGRLKRSAALSHPKGRSRYNAAKSDFIAQTLCDRPSE